MVKASLARRLCTLLACLVVTLSNSFAQHDTTSFAVPEGTVPPRQYRPPSEPIPRGWIIAGVAIAVLAVAAGLYITLKAWRSANLFERKYRFPNAGNAALRFGGTRNGGLMAVIEPKRNGTA